MKSGNEMNEKNKERLESLVERLEKAARKLPLAEKASDIVPPEGNPQAAIMFIGEAAGYHEHKQRRPFVGVAGKLLTRCLEEIGLTRENVWISNILKVRPPNNRDPLPQEVEAYRPYLDEEIRIIKPKVVATLGRFSLRKFLPNAYISKVHGQARWVDWEGERLLVFPMYHPAAALRSTQVMQQVKEDFAKLKRLVENQDETAGQEPEEAQNPRKEAEPESKKNKQLSLI